MFSVVRRAKWSEGVAGRQVTVGVIEQPGWVEVMRRSRVLPSSSSPRALWVGKLTCWTRLKSDRMDRNCDASESDGLLQWILKSPVMRKLQ